MIELKLNEELVEMLDKYFPKGECKNRGNALVLFATAQRELEKQKEEYEKKIQELNNKIDDLLKLTIY